MKLSLLPALVFLGMFVHSMQSSTSHAENQERTLVIIKPDGVQRGLIGEVFKRCERKGFKMVAVKVLHVSVIILFIIANSLFFQCAMYTSKTGNTRTNSRAILTL